ncbi:MAG: hypothetical protein AAF843_20145, partial [Bacteroidota bacterium]
YITGDSYYSTTNVRGGIDYYDLVEIGHSSNHFLKFYKDSLGELEVLHHTLGKSHFLEKKEIRKESLFSYSDLLALNGSEITDIIKPIYKIGIDRAVSLDLFKEPDHKSEIIWRLKGGGPDYDTDHYEIKVIKINKNWARVVAKLFRYDSSKDSSGMGCGFKMIDEKVGWILISDTNGKPNIWYTTTNY